MQPRDIPYATPVKFTWNDSLSIGGWKYPDDPFRDPSPITSAGFVIRGDRKTKFLVISSSVNGGLTASIDHLYVPWAAIIRLDLFTFPDAK